MVSKSETTTSSDSKLVLPTIDPDYEKARVLNLYSEWDMLKVINEYMLDFLPKAGRPLNHKYANIKLGVTLLSLVFGVYCQFGLVFPQDRNMILLFSGIFMALAFTYIIFDYYVTEYNHAAVMSTKPEQGLIFIDSLVPKSTGELWLAFRSVGTKSCLTVRQPLTKFFDEDGFLIHSAVFETVMQGIKTYEEGIERDSPAKIAALKKNKPFKFA